MEYEKLRPKIGRWIGVAHTCGRSMKYFILTDRGKVIINTTLQHQTATEVQHPEVQKLIKDYHEIINAEIGKVVVVDSDNDNVLVYKYELRDPMKYDNGAYYGFDKDVDVDESID